MRSSPPGRHHLFLHPRLSLSVGLFTNSRRPQGIRLRNRSGIQFIVARRNTQGPPIMNHSNIRPGQYRVRCVSIHSSLLSSQLHEDRPGRLGASLSPGPAIWFCARREVRSLTRPHPPFLSYALFSASACGSSDAMRFPDFKVILRFAFPSLDIHRPDFKNWGLKEEKR